MTLFGLHLSGIKPDVDRCLQKRDQLETLPLDERRDDGDLDGTVGTRESRR